MEEFPRIQRLPPYVFSIVDDLKMKARRRGEDIIDLGMGNPDIPTPPAIVKKLIEAVKNPRNHRYSASRGISKLRAAIANWYGTQFGVDIDPETEAIVTIGAKEGLAHLVLATIGSGDVVFVPTPAYPIHTYSVIIAGGDLRTIPLVKGRDFFDDLQTATDRSGPNPRC
jgi:alanine-synthesizing transaminase